MKNENLLKKMKENNLDYVIISSKYTLYYFTGLWIEPGERFMALIADRDGNFHMILNRLFAVNTKINFVYYSDTDKPIDILSGQIMKNARIGVEKTWQAKFLLELIEKRNDLKIINFSDKIDTIRMIKDTEEIRKMAEASELNDIAMAKMIELIKNDVREKDIVKKIPDIYESVGAEGISFDPLIAFGKNAAEPHHESDNTVIKTGDSVIIDVGCVKNRYCSDMTRTVFFNDVDDFGMKIYKTVYEANLRAIEKVKPGLRLSEIDYAARGYIEDKGFGEYFTHRTGHNIGIEVHEYPDVSAVSEIIAEPGMVFSIEPGIYVPGKTGVRIEDLVVVTEKGCKVLNSYTKDLIIV
ncbi:MAG TPA: Xaa-Pro peptidase family protein [Tepiditoga sp.]|nr:Xaa-Pro peptidase family protein [Tepiditoga sp.]